MTYSKTGAFLRPMPWIVLAILVVALSACSAMPEPDRPETEGPPAPTEGVQNGAADLDKTQWTLVRINGVAVAQGITATIAFDGDQVSGQGGCNGYGGKYAIEGNTVTFSEVMSTLMACDEPVMSVEQAFMGVLQGSATFAVAGQTLTLTGADGGVLVFSKQ